MIRVVFETRRECRGDVAPMTCVEVLPKHRVDLKTSKIDGNTVKILKATFFELNIPKTKTDAPVSGRRDYRALRELLVKHFRRSRWRWYVLSFIDSLIADLDWEVALAESGYKTKPFTYHWDRFLEELDRGLAITPSTRRIVSRLNKQPWLKPYQEGNHDAKDYSRPAHQCPYYRMGRL